MNINVIKTIPAALCICLGLVACTQQIEQDQYEDPVIGLEGNKINLYPLGETMDVSVYPAGSWELDIQDMSDGITVTDEGDHIRLVASENLHDVREGYFRINYLDHRNTISVQQDRVNFSVSDATDNTIELYDEVETSGGISRFSVTSNIFYRVYPEGNSKLEVKEENAESFEVVDSAATTLNGNDIKADVMVDLLDKAGKKVVKEKYFRFTLIQRASIFKWKGTTSAPDFQEPKNYSFTFNDSDSENFEFESSGKWSVEAPDWIKLEDGYGSSVEEGVAGDHKLYLSVLEHTSTEKSRSGSVKITAEGYPNDPLVINVTQGAAPEIGIDPSSIEIPEGKSKEIKVLIDETLESEISWSIKSGSDAISLPDVTNGSSIRVTGVKEGIAELQAEVYVNGKSVTKLTCTITVVREFEGAGGDGRDPIGDDEGEW